MIRGVGNPLIAVYARCYLCRVGIALDKVVEYDFVKENFYDFLFTYHQLFNQTVEYELRVKQNMSMHAYLNLYTPALDWILQVIGATASDYDLTEIFSRCKQLSNK